MLKKTALFLGLEFIVTNLSDEIQIEFKSLCLTFKERVQKRNLTRTVEDGIKQNPDLLNSVAYMGTVKPEQTTTS